MLLVEAQWSKRKQKKPRGSNIGLVSLDALKSSCFWILLIFQIVQNACHQLKYKQNLKHERKVHAAM